jgi:hypothetical protein
MGQYGSDQLQGAAQGKRLRDASLQSVAMDRYPEVSAARPEIAVIVHKHDEARRGECLSETLKAVFLGPSKSVGHGDGGLGTIPFGQEQPRAKFNSALCRDPHLELQSHCQPPRKSLAIQGATPVAVTPSG